MFCPSCGKPNTTDQKFCRACGMNLERSAASLLEQFPNQDRLDLQRQEKLLEKFGQIAFTGLGIAIGLGILGLIYTIVVNFILNGENPLAGIVFALFIIFAGLALGYVIWNESLKEKRGRLDNTRAITGVVERGQERLADGASFEPVPSVTENTTRKLKSESRRDA